MDKPESFFGVFDYHVFEPQAIDYGLIYEMITITRDVVTSSGLKLNKGDEYDAVWFLFDKQVFQFIKWECVDECTSEIGPGSIEIPQSELAPFLYWNKWKESMN